MSGPAALFTVGAVGAAAYYANRKAPAQDDNAPFNIARRRSSTTPIDHSWDSRKQAEYVWRRNSGLNFSHYSNAKNKPSEVEQSSK
ncbi:hypothetical protein BY458DRAFT_499941 [Sporodiniella umbellata]|nr:hypothetical protein BY458DRAFT_499941 [Sporodiniella umbellata]